MVFCKVLWLAILASFSVAVDTELMVKQDVKGKEASMIIAHLKKFPQQLKSTPMEFDKYTKLPYGEQLTITRPTDSDLVIASIWDEMKMEQKRSATKSFTLNYKAIEDDVFLVYPFCVLKRTGGAIDSMIIGVTAYDVYLETKEERTGILLKVTDDDKKVTIKVSQIYTKAICEHCYFSLVEDEGKEVSKNEYTYDKVDAVNVSFGALSTLEVPEYVLKNHQEGFYHVEQKEGVMVVIKKAGKKLLVTFEEARII